MGKHVDAEVKQQVANDVASGLTVAAVAAKYGVSPTSIGRWADGDNRSRPVKQGEGQRELYLSHIKAWEKSGLSKAQYCREKGINAQRFMYYSSYPYKDATTNGHVKAHTNGHAALPNGFVKVGEPETKNEWEYKVEMKGFVVYCNIDGLQQIVRRLAEANQ